ncbi:MAG: hypothetical protein E7548_03775 [Ruminococcaceae bacterium]|nr:hypothetical protein [Oscillospiraceae bacterium]
MKRILSLVFSLVFLCGCAAKATNVKPVLSGITFEARLSFYNEVFCCSGAVSKEGELTLRVNEPQTIKGMKITVKKDHLSAEFKGLTYTPKTEKLPFANVAQVLYSVLSDALYRNPQVKVQDNKFFIESAENDKYYKIILTEAGFPVSMEIPSAALTAEFSNVSILK